MNDLDGRPTGELCPSCKRGMIVYNGNYFCANLGQSCDWALPHGEWNSRAQSDVPKKYRALEKRLIASMKEQP